MVKNLLALHMATAQQLGFLVETDEVYERLYNQGETIPITALMALLPYVNDYQLMNIVKDGYELELNLWSPDHKNDVAMIRVNLRATKINGIETEEVETNILHDYINVVEAIGIFRIAVEKFENQCSNLFRYHCLPKVLR